MKNSTQSQRRKKSNKKSTKKNRRSKSTKAGKSNNRRSKGKSKKNDTKTSSKFLPEYSDTIITFLIHMTRRDGFLCPRVANTFRTLLDWTKDPRVGRKSCEEDSAYLNYHVTVSVQRFKLRHLYGQRHQLYDSKARKREMSEFLHKIESLGHTPKRMTETLLKKHFDMNQNSLTHDLAVSKLIKFKMNLPNPSTTRLCIYFQKNGHVVSIQITYSWVIIS